MLNEFIEEINRLQKIEKENEYLKKDKQRMSDKLYELMMNEYNLKSYEQRCNEHKNLNCSCCRFNSYCDIQLNLPENILMPIPSDCGWFPSLTGCSKFEWD